MNDTRLIERWWPIPGPATDTLGTACPACPGHSRESGNPSVPGTALLGTLVSRPHRPVADLLWSVCGRDARVPRGTSAPKGAMRVLPSAGRVGEAHERYAADRAVVAGRGDRRPMPRERRALPAPVIPAQAGIQVSRERRSWVRCVCFRAPSGRVKRMSDTRRIEWWRPVADVGDGHPGCAGVSPASVGCGPAMVRMRAGRPRSQGHEGTQGRRARASGRRVGR